ncbi:MAG: hypothetical protein CML46_14445 [Rhodobacteraceae bacterium]|nr:hypothetical protein [Paracoccaceae bacterium]MBR28127.1 hypothetical protein [Paracoccaceae bacterium]
MDITRAEQRVLHLLAQGGWIEVSKSRAAKIEQARCRTREGHVYTGLDLRLFRRLRRLRAIASSGGRPYRITARGLALVRAQPDNR